MKKLLIMFLTIIFSISVTPQIADGGFDSIKSENLMMTVETLCSKVFDGRLPGSEGYDKAAALVSERFKQIGLVPAGDEEYFQYLNVEYNKIESPVVFKVIYRESVISYQHGKDFILRGFTGSGDFILPVAFCGYGISRPDLGYDDYTNINVKDKIVMVFKQNPSWKINDEAWGQEYPREKSTIAYQQGARGILFVSKPNDTKPQPLIGSVMHGEGVQLEDFPQLHLSLETANELLSQADISINECQTTIDETINPLSFLTRMNAEIKVNAEYENSAKTVNVVGMIEGNDPNQKDEYLVVGAHLDHVGSQAELLFPGANDNASGSAAVLEIAEAFKASNSKPKRSILFVLFASEEQGLFGSKYFVNNLNIDPEKIIAMFNLDSIGSGDSIQIGNGKSSPELWNIARKMDKENFNLVVEDTWGGGGADLTPFYEKGIPGLYFVSKYSYEHLHLPTDTPETLNLDLLANIVRLAYLTAREVADGNYRKETTIK